MNGIIPHFLPWVNATVFLLCSLYKTADKDLVITQLFVFFSEIEKIHQSVWTHEEQQTLVLPDGTAAAQEAQQEEHGAHGQDDVDAREEEWVGRHDLPEAHRVQQHPDAHAQQEGAAQLGERGSVCAPTILFYYVKMF